jgi:hypothetical protein
VRKTITRIWSYTVMTIMLAVVAGVVFKGCDAIGGCVERQTTCYDACVDAGYAEFIIKDRRCLCLTPYIEVAP